MRTPQRVQKCTRECFCSAIQARARPCYHEPLLGKQVSHSFIALAQASTKCSSVSAQNASESSSKRLVSISLASFSSTKSTPFWLRLGVTDANTPQLVLQSTSFCLKWMVFSRTRESLSSAPQTIKTLSTQQL